MCSVQPEICLCFVSPLLCFYVRCTTTEVMKENESKRQHWGESVKGRVSSDYKASLICC